MLEHRAQTREDAREIAGPFAGPILVSMRTPDTRPDDTPDALLCRAIRLYLASRGMSPPAFGLAALGDPGFVAGFARGRCPRLAAVDRALGFIGAAPSGPGFRTEVEAFLEATCYSARLLNADQRLNLLIWLESRWSRFHAEQQRGTFLQFHPFARANAARGCGSQRCQSRSESSISIRQWSLGPHSSGSLRTRTSSKLVSSVEANTKSNWRVAISGNRWLE